MFGLQNMVTLIIKEEIRIQKHIADILYGEDYQVIDDQKGIIQFNLKQDKYINLHDVGTYDNAMLDTYTDVRANILQILQQLTSKALAALEHRILITELNTMNIWIVNNQNTNDYQSVKYSVIFTHSKMITHVVGSTAKQEQQTAQNLKTIIINLIGAIYKDTTNKITWPDTEPKTIEELYLQYNQKKSTINQTLTSKKLSKEEKKMIDGILQQYSRPNIILIGDQSTISIITNLINIDCQKLIFKHYKSDQDSLNNMLQNLQTHLVTDINKQLQIQNQTIQVEHSKITQFYQVKFQGLQLEFQQLQQIDLAYLLKPLIQMGYFNSISSFMNDGMLGYAKQILKSSMHQMMHSILEQQVKNNPLQYLSAQKTLSLIQDITLEYGIQYATDNYNDFFHQLHKYIQEMVTSIVEYRFHRPLQVGMFVDQMTIYEQIIQILGEFKLNYDQVLALQYNYYIEQILQQNQVVFNLASNFYGWKFDKISETIMPIKLEQQQYQVKMEYTTIRNIINIEEFAEQQVDKYLTQLVSDVLNNLRSELEDIENS